MSDRVSEWPENGIERRDWLKTVASLAGATGLGAYFSYREGSTVSADTPVTPVPPVGRWTFDSGSGRTITDLVSGTRTELNHRPGGEPLWIGAGDGASLVFDGYTTNATYGVDELADPLAEVEQLTIDAWVAPRSFSATSEPDTVVEAVGDDDFPGFRFGANTYGNWVFAVEDGTGGFALVLSTDDEYTLPTHEWSHVTAVFDATHDDGSGRLALYLNGELAAEEVGIPTGVLPLSGRTLSIGRNQNTADVFGAEMFEFDMFDGAIGQLELYDVALDAATVASKHSEESDALHTTGEDRWEELVIHPDRYDGDPFRPTYHAIPPQHWMNEPHAPLYYEPEGVDPGEGRYHLFYQHNAKGPYFHHQSWGHWVGDDLVNWEPLPQALVPQEDLLDPAGCWAGGTVLDDDDDPTAFYTGALYDGEAGQGVIRASADDPSDPDLREWSQDADPARLREGVVLDPPPENINSASPYPVDWPGEYPPHFRDPNVWREQDPETGEYEWICLVGGAYEQIRDPIEGVERRVGATWVYTSDDFENWTFEGELLDWRRGPVLPDDVEAADPFIANEWELPVVLPIDGDWQSAETFVFCINPLWAIPDPDGVDVPSLSIFDIYYWIGEWNAEGNYQFTPDHEEARVMDFGDSHFTGCSGMYDRHPERERSVLFTIAQDYRLPQFHYDAGWAHNAGLPVELFLHENSTPGEPVLGRRPATEVESLRRTDKPTYSNEDASPETVNAELDDVSADTAEIRLKLDATDAELYGFRLRRTDDGQEETYVYYDENDGSIHVDRRASSADPELLIETGRQSDLTHEATLDTSGGSIDFRVFVDRSMVECYVNERQSVTTRAYPERSDADGFRVFYAGDVTVESLQVWELRGISDRL